MDRYFIELMLDQLNKGSNTFKKQAWEDMLNSFNAKFCLQLGKRILKQRYEKLLKYYSDIRSLIEQKGFSWDENQQMVVAEDGAWDKYIKAHPDACSYRRKKLLNYEELGLIYGNAIIDDGHMHRDKNFEKGNLQIKIGGEDTQCHPDDDYSKTYWTPSSDRYFIDLMLEEVHRGSKIDTSFNIQAWIDMALLVRERFGLPHDKDLLRSRHKHFRNLYYDMKNLLYQRGSSWDETRQLIAAYDDVCDAYFKGHSDAKSYRTKPGPNFNDLCLIYGNSNLGGKGNLLGLDIGCCGANQLNDSHQQRTAKWTPSRDRYFINLMLEQVRQGYMVSQKFNEEAWGEMATKLNAEFGSHYNRNDLKIRFINLRKRFNDMKILIDDNGFYWDEMHQMITANDDHWDLYLKEHPEARAYHCRTLPNYNDLFLIYGNANPNWKHYDSTPLTCGFKHAFELNLDEDDKCPSSRGHPRIQHWTKAMENYFIDLMLEQVQKGNKNGHTFNEQAWAWIITSFNEKFGLLLDKDILENWYVSLMKVYENMTDLLNQPGFAWEEIQQVVIADDDTWKEYIEEHPDAIKYRDRNMAVYNDLCAIYDDTTPFKRSSCPDLESEIDNNALDVGINDIFQDLQDLVAEFEIPDCRKKRKSATSSTSACSTKSQRCNKRVLRRTRNSNPHVGKLLVPKEEGKDFTSIVTPELGANPHMVKLLVAKEEGKDYIPIETIVDALQVLPGMNDELFLEACKLLENEKKIKMFVAMDVNQRTKWLLKKLQRQLH
ncbi:uncharacterized protein LOC120011071 [Tripterygium wilfordii]|uniref:uncharacterized protein LOC120011071 n=1 Tax=Tripterygium wilfordii TaxID=458696 RepID=UPI0018F81A39|nr:uncharacterized protein LOC120011071 [Tripterygium wilfordii]